MSEQRAGEVISVIIPVYNVEKYLETCLSSVVKQTYTGLEIILVDDGATDRSGKICDEYAGEDDRIRVIHQENQGLAAARNTGIECASGNYLFFVDADDFLSADGIETVYELLQKTGADMSVGGYLSSDKEQDMEGILHAGRYHVYATEDALARLNDWRNEETTCLITAWGTLYKKSLFDGVRYPAGKWHEDEFVAHRLLARAQKICVLEDPIYFYRQHGDSFMSTIDAHSQIRHMVLFEALKDRVHFLSEAFPELVNDAVHHILREANSFYDIFLQDKHWKKDQELKNAVRQLVAIYRNVYVMYWKQLRGREKVMGGLFCVFPSGYHWLAGLKWRKKDDKTV